MGYTTHMNGLSGITDVGTAIGAVVADPCLLQVARMTNELAALEKSSSSGATSAPATRGIGLCKAVGPLEAVLYIRRRPWVIPVGATAFVLGLVGLGYVLGRSGRKGK